MNVITIHDVFFDKNKVDNFVISKSGSNVPLEQKATVRQITTNLDEEERWLYFKLASFLKDYREYNPHEKWLSKEKLERMIRN